MKINELKKIYSKFFKDGEAKKQKKRVLLISLVNQNKKEVNKFIIK